MKRKRFVKLLMGAGYSRNRANSIATLVPGFKFNFLGQPLRPYLTYDEAWRVFSALARVQAVFHGVKAVAQTLMDAMDSVAKGGDSAEA